MGGLFITVNFPEYFVMGINYPYGIFFIFVFICHGEILPCTAGSVKGYILGCAGSLQKKFYLNKTKTIDKVLSYLKPISYKDGQSDR